MERDSFRENLQIGWDSTSLTTFMECPRKYQYSLLFARAPRKESVHLTFGIYFHQGLEHYDKLRANGIDHNTAVHSVVKDMLVRSHGWNSDDNYKNRETLIRSLVWYMEEFPSESDPAKTLILHNGSPAVELSFRFEFPDLKTPWGDRYLYCGHLDRVAEFDGALWVMDRKTTKSAITSYWFEKFRPHNQMTGYTIGGHITLSRPLKGVIIDGAQIGVNFTRLMRGITLRSQDELEEWFANASVHIRLAERYAESDFWPMNLSACDNYGGCPFRPICAKPPAQRQRWLEAEYVERIWDPLKVRGDI